jgi:hypothetical protein
VIRDRAEISGLQQVEARSGVGYASHDGPGSYSGFMVPRLMRFLEERP